MKPYKPIQWKDTQAGQKVWIIGTESGQFRAYGPHTVHSPVNRRLVNERGTIFNHYSEDLLVKEEEE